MTAAELYTTFGITPAEYNQSETACEFGRRMVQSHPALVEQKGVRYSSGTSNNAKKDEKTNNYAMYTY